MVYNYSYGLVTGTLDLQVQNRDPGPPSIQAVRTLLDCKGLGMAAWAVHGVVQGLWKGVFSIVKEGPEKKVRGSWPSYAGFRPRTIMFQLPLPVAWSIILQVSAGNLVANPSN